MSTDIRETAQIFRSPSEARQKWGTAREPHFQSSMRRRRIRHRRKSAPPEQPSGRLAGSRCGHGLLAFIDENLRFPAFKTSARRKAICILPAIRQVIGRWSLNIAKHGRG